jgi:hypothetical protein
MSRAVITDEDFSWNTMSPAFCATPSEDDKHQLTAMWESLCVASWISGKSSGNKGTDSPIQTLDYMPYGSTRISSSSPVATNEKRKYIGQYFDPTSSLSYLNARY